ncbi:LysR substrate-binding domain-containing protein [Orrella sp. JC864]|uniref:LysR substrate-binding domain-containing protein n=1 Tax=Orrella sp. JC864 TaxID=3120298 RepID=UPI0012BD6371
MEIRHLRYFAVLAEELNFTRAAERLHMSQPPLSMQIAQLERELGVKLFVRGNRRVALTEAGQAFLSDVRTVLARVKDATARVRAVDAGQAGRVEVGLSGSHFLGPVPHLIAHYTRTHPQVSILLNEMNPASQIDALRERRIDVSISRTAVDDQDLCSIPIWPDPLVAALPARHRLASRRRLALAELAEEPFVMLRLDTSAFAGRLYELCLRAGVRPRVVQTVAEIPAQLALVGAGLGVALVPVSTVAHFAGSVAACRLPAAVSGGGVHAVTRRNARQRVVEAFVQAAARWQAQPAAPDPAAMGPAPAAPAPEPACRPR